MTSHRRYGQIVRPRQLKNLLPLLLALLVVGCLIRTPDNPDDVAKEFTEALVDGRPAKALLYVNSTDRANETFRKALDIDSARLADCRGKLGAFEGADLGPDRRGYRYKFTELCGIGYLHHEMVIQVEKQNNRWVVALYIPQIFIT